MLFCSDAPLFFNSLVVVVVAVEVDRSVGEPPTSQSITNAPILTQHLLSFTFISKVSC